MFSPPELNLSIDLFSLLKNVTLSVVSKARMAMEYSSP
jgi:hypothetical protein